MIKFNIDFFMIAISMYVIRIMFGQLVWKYECIELGRIGHGPVFVMLLYCALLITHILNSIRCPRRLRSNQTTDHFEVKVFEFKATLKTETHIAKFQSANNKLHTVNKSIQHQKQVFLSPCVCFICIHYTYISKWVRLLCDQVSHRTYFKV